MVAFAKTSGLSGSMDVSCSVIVGKEDEDDRWRMLEGDSGIALARLQNILLDAANDAVE